MMKLVDLLKEIGDASARPYEWYELEDQEDYKSYGFETDQEDYKLEIAVSEGDKERDSAVVAFGTVIDDDELGYQGSFTDYEKVPNKGELYKVMATVVSILKDFIKKNKQIKYIYFKTNKQGDQSSRLKLYKKYIQSQIPNAKVDTKNIDGEEATMITLKELNLPRL